MKRLLILFLAVCFIAAVICKPEQLADVASEESKEQVIEQKEDEMLSNGDDETKDEPVKDEEQNEEESLDELFDEKDTPEETNDDIPTSDEETSEDVKEDGHEGEDPQTDESESEDQIINQQEEGKGGEDPVTKDEEVKDEEEKEEKDEQANDEKKDDEQKKDERIFHNDPQVGYTIRKNHIHDALEVMSPSYSLSFQVKLLYITNVWTNVLHFTTGGNIGQIGYRIPAVFINPHGTRIYVCTTINNNNNYCVSTDLPLHKYVHCSINQHPQGLKYFWRVYCNGKQLANIENKIPRYYHNVKVYKADPWYAATPANIRYFNFYDNQYARHPIRKSAIIKYFPTYFTEYEVSFYVRPYGKVNTWGSILHVTKGGNHGQHGDRIPGIWFHPNSHKLLIATSLNGNHNYHWTSHELPTNKDTEVNVKQKAVGCCAHCHHCHHYFIITIDKKVRLNVKNNIPRTFHNVRVYQGDPWYPAAKAYIRNVKVSTSTGGGYKLSKSKVLRVIPRIEKQWYLSFDVRHVGVTVKHWTNILHFTTGDNYGKIGYRIPGIWFAPNTRQLHICYAINNNHNYCYNTPAIPFNKYTNIQVAQIYETDNKRYRYIILVNRVVKFTIYNNRPYEFHHVRMWGADPWYSAANAFIKNLVFRNIYHKK